MVDSLIEKGPFISFVYVMLTSMVLISLKFEDRLLLKSCEIQHRFIQQHWWENWTNYLNKNIMDETNFGESRSGYRLVRNNSFEFPQVSGGFQALHQRRPSYVRNSCVTPDAYNNKGFFRYYDQDQSMWNFPSCNKDQSSCKCSASTPKIHQALEFDPRHEGFLYLPRSHSPAPSIPSYYSLKANPSKKKKEVQHFSDSKTLGRHKGKNHSSLIINSAWSPKENVKNCHSERCLKWLQSSTDFESMEEQMKELDMNIELLKWKRKHLESVHQQKMQVGDVEIFSHLHCLASSILRKVCQPQFAILRIWFVL